MEGDNPHGNHEDPLDELVFIILSAQTESYLYQQTFRDLKAAYTPMENPADADRMRRAMGQLSLWLGRAVDEGRTALNSLRATTTEKTTSPKLSAARSEIAAGNIPSKLCFLSLASRRNCIRCCAMRFIALATSNHQCLRAFGRHLYGGDIELRE